MKFRSRLRHLVRRIGYDVAPFRPVDCPNVRRRMMLDMYRIDTVIDVGANTGQYGQRLRDAGYPRRIVSFEPLPDAFRQLSERASVDSLWDCEQVALGDGDGDALLHVSRNSVCSSLLPTEKRLLRAEPRSVHTDSTAVPLRRLDSVVQGLVALDGHLWLKLDVQGYERPVLDGASEVLKRIQVVEAELSLVPLYEGQALYREIVEFLISLGFDIIGLERGFTDARTGQVLQVDGVFARADGCR
jgi:FkbM family methyltransferase